MALRVTLDVARCFRDRSQPQSLDVIAVRLGASLRTASALLDLLQAGGIVSLCSGPEGDIRYQLGRPADDIRIGEILEAIRGSRWSLPSGSRAEDGGRPADRVVDSLLHEAAAARASIDDQSLADLLAAVPREAQPLR